MNRRLILALVALLAAGLSYYQRQHHSAAPTARNPPIAPTAQSAPTAQVAVGGGSSIQAAIDARSSDVFVEGSGVVSRTLRDDDSGLRHQRFLVRLDSGATILIAHNIDIAPRIADLAEGERIAFGGEYVWNEKGGLLHWTHRDPQRRHRTGWLDYHGHRYQ